MNELVDMILEDIKDNPNQVTEDQLRALAFYCGDCFKKNEDETLTRLMTLIKHSWSSDISNRFFSILKDYENLS